MISRIPQLSALPQPLPQPRFSGHTDPEQPFDEMNAEFARMMAEAGLDAAYDCFNASRLVAISQAHGLQIAPGEIRYLVNESKIISWTFQVSDSQIRLYRGQYPDVKPLIDTNQISPEYTAPLGCEVRVTDRGQNYSVRLTKPRRAQNATLDVQKLGN